MKNKILPLAISAAVTALALTVWAASPTYKSASASGTAAAPAQVLLPADPYTQIRIVNVAYSTDTNNAYLYFSSGTVAYWQTCTNTGTTAVTNRINSTNGLVPGAALVLQHAGTNIVAVLASFNSTTNTALGSGTNVVLASGGWGVIPAPGDAIYLMGTTNKISAATSSTINGEAIYCATYSGRPVRILLSPALSANSIDNASAHYD